MTREELIAKVEGLTGIDRDVDCAIDDMLCDQKFNWESGKARSLREKAEARWGKVGEHRDGIRHYTSSVDAVLALIQERLPGWYVTDATSSADGWWWQLSDETYVVEGRGLFPAPTLLTAYLRADAATPAAREGEEAHGS